MRDVFEIGEQEDLLKDSARVVEFFGDVAEIGDYEIIQSIQRQLLFMHRRNNALEAVIRVGRCEGSRPLSI